MEKTVKVTQSLRAWIRILTRLDATRQRLVREWHAGLAARPVRAFLGPQQAAWLAERKQEAWNLRPAVRLLTSARVCIRDAIGRANAASGIADLLTERARGDVLARIISVEGNQWAPLHIHVEELADVFRRSLEGSRVRQGQAGPATPDSAGETSGAGDALGFREEERAEWKVPPAEVSVDPLPTEARQRLRRRRQEFLARRARIGDDLADANAQSLTVALPAGVLPLLYLEPDPPVPGDGR